MARETKVGLLVGLCVILLIGIIVADHLSVAREQKPAPLGNLAENTSRGLGSPTTPLTPGLGEGLGVTVDGAPRTQPIPQPHDLLTSPSPTAPAGEPSRPQFVGAELPVANRVGGDSALPPVPGVGRVMPLTGSPTPGSPGSPGVAVVNTGPGPAPTPLAFNPTPAPAPAPAPVMKEYVVQSGDSVYRIAQKELGKGEDWVRIQKANPTLVGPKGQIALGAKLLIPVPAPAADARSADALRGTGMFDGSTPGLGGTVTPAPAPAQTTIVVQPGQNLMQLARQHLGSSNRWKELLDANRDQISKPEQLRAGMKLRLPANAGSAPTAVPEHRPITPAVVRTAAATASDTAAITPAGNTTAARKGTYTVQRGDTLRRIAARKLGDADKWEALFQANRDKVKDPGQLQTGLVLALP